MTIRPMFPLESVRLPGEELPLRIFEPRYGALVRECLDGAMQFGVVLIAAGREVGGEDARCDVGSMAHIVDCQDLGEGRYRLECEMRERIRVTSWLDDDPYPRAEIRILDDFEWDESLVPLRNKAEAAVRALLELATALTGEGWPSDIELADEPVAACWQLAAIAPLGPLDQVELLASPDLASMLVTLTEFAGGAEESFRGLYSD